MILEFPYCKLDNSFTVCNCDEACLMVTLRLGEREISVEGMVDSGCTITHVNAEIATILDIDLSVCPTTQTVGVGGPTVGYIHSIEFEVKGAGEPFNGPVIFIHDLPVTVLLGQNNFFDKFHIHFQKSKHRFTIERVA